MLTISWRSKRFWLGAFVALIILWLAVVNLALLVAKERVPVALPTTFYATEYEGFVLAGGTWTLEGDRQAFPLQTTKIECRRDLGTCTTATAEVSIGDILSVNSETLPITEWTKTHVVFTDDSPGCVRYIYTINFATKSVTGVRSRKSVPTGNPASDCSQLTDELRMTMREGFEVSYQMEQAALPWYGRLALAPFALLR